MNETNAGPEDSRSADDPKSDGAPTNDGSEDGSSAGPNFIRQIIDQELAAGKHSTIVTRFPPEPNGFLHIGHAKAICINFETAESYGGRYHLRFDDTNPAKEDMKFVEAISSEIRWLGFDWKEHLYFASDYYQQLYDYALQLIRDGKAYVDSLSPEEMREYRGTLTEPGKESPYRSRSVDENLELFEGMKAGKFKEGEHILRAKIDMSSPNMNMRDPAIYRILHQEHYRTGNTWCIYPMYDYAHCISDAIEGITHSLCSLEFEDHRPLYDWFIDQLPVPSKPRQIEFGRVGLSYTVLSKRTLRALVEEGHVKGWDDPRMPTLSGFRRRGVPPESIRDFCSRTGVAKANIVADLELLHFSIREHLNSRSQRRMAVLDPVKVVITNYPEEQEEELEAVNNPNDDSAGTRKLPFSRELYIEREDFMLDPPKKFFRLAPGREVRLQHAYLVTCKNVVQDSSSGVITEIHCEYDPESRGGMPKDGRKVKGTLHWVSARHALDAELRLYDKLFLTENPLKFEEGGSYADNLNPNSVEILKSCKVEPSLGESPAEARFQFLRKGYFCADRFDHSKNHPVFNRTVPLRDGWAKSQKS